MQRGRPRVCKGRWSLSCAAGRCHPDDRSVADSESMRSQQCVQAGSMGNCDDDDAPWFVECNAVVQCQYACRGVCVPTYCN